MGDTNIDQIKKENLKRLLQEHHLTQRKLAELINTDPQYLNKIIKGHRGLNDDLISKICKALKIKPYEFYIDGETPIISNTEEQLHLTKFRKAQELNIAEEVDLFTDYAITKATTQTPQGHTAKTERKKKTTSGSGM